MLVLDGGSSNDACAELALLDYSGLLVARHYFDRETVYEAVRCHWQVKLEPEAAVRRKFYGRTKTLRIDNVTAGRSEDYLFLVIHQLVHVVPDKHGETE